MSPQFQGQGRWPGPLSRRTNRMLWMSLLLSAGVILVMQTRLDGRNSSPYGCATFIVIIFYDTTLLVLSSKERNVAVAGQLELQAGIGKVEEEEKAVDKEVEEVIAAAHLRRTINFWVSAICQSGIAALMLYVASRLALLLQSSERTLQAPVMEFVDLVFSAGQMSVLVYVGVCCVVCEFEITMYLAANAFLTEH